ncbi:hypothetical protein [Synechocystis sp. PCC 7339]|uniref:hypothetical protein n=1 Tax=Synechocystis sp. PCC 7339 TaxID=2782213 RepID=UPI001CBCA702|nr:hypothetical protein [Synechocystis sp. PCC 7339]
METKDTDWHESIRECVKHGAGRRVRLWSFEVKKKLNMGNVREYFFRQSAIPHGQMKVT